MDEKTVLGNTGNVITVLLAEMCLWGGNAVIGERGRPGKDRDIYRLVADRLWVTHDERDLAVGEICQSLRPGVSRYAKNAWDYTFQVAVNHARRDGIFLASERRGFWELSEAGK